MIEDGTVRTDQQSSWQLLLQFRLSGASSSEHQSLQRIMEAVGTLGLETSAMDRIGRAVLDALRQHTRREMQDLRHAPLSIRVWVSDGIGGYPLGRSSGTRGSGLGKRRGWGFFLVQKEERDPQTCAGEAYHLIELYLYQERGHTGRDTGPEVIVPPMGVSGQ